MKANRRIHVIVSMFILVGLFASVFIRDSNDAQDTHLKDQMVSISVTLTWIKNIVLDAVMGMWQFSEIPISEPLRKPRTPGLSPNLSSCHKAYAKGDYMVYCCPPNEEADEPVIDFKFPDPSLPHRTRRPIHLRDKDYLAKYKRAITIMKSLPYEDPRSYARQADMHCIYCTGAYNQKYANVGLNIHRSWLFFPWHRMLIYFHERILAKLIDDESFSLSFWQWDDPEGMVVPEIYMKEPFVDKERSDIHVRPNKIVDVNYHFKNNNNRPEVQISKNLAFMYNQMVSGAKKVELFMGCVYKPGKGNSCDGPGTVELAPHNSLHSWVGKESNRFLQDMGVFYTAARDPLFWAHHPNIDRLWEVWRELRDYEPAILDPDWLESYFFFHDENAQLVRIKIRDVLNITMLGYSYQKVDLPWLNARPKPSIDPTIARHVLNTRNNGYLATQSSDFRPKGRSLDNKFIVKVFRPDEQKRAGKGEEVILVVYGIDIKEDVPVKFDVYINAIHGETLGPEHREFAGTFVNVPKGVTLIRNEGDEKPIRKATLKLGISELLEDLQASEDDFIWVTVVPRGGTGGSTTVDGLRIEYMK